MVNEIKQKDLPNILNILKGYMQVYQQEINIVQIASKMKKLSRRKKVFKKKTQKKKKGKKYTHAHKYQCAHKHRGVYSVLILL